MKKNFRLTAAIALFFILVAGFSGIYMLAGKNSSADVPGEPEQFQITGEKMGESGSYISEVYLDGYAYRPSEWLRLTRYTGKELPAAPGEKIGEVTLDLKGIHYTGAPPDFSGTRDAGSVIYEIQGTRREYAVLVVDPYGFADIYYREEKAAESEHASLTLQELLRMRTGTAEVIAVELRDGYDGSWMRTSEDGDLISLINSGLIDQKFISTTGLGKNPYYGSLAIPVNLMLPGGYAVHLQVFPDEACAAVPGAGFLRLSAELSLALQSLYASGGQYPSISELLPYAEEEIEYLYLADTVNGREVLCENPKWSRLGLFSILRYYRVSPQTDGTGLRLVLKTVLGKSPADNITVLFFESEDKEIIPQINGQFYKPAKGKLAFPELKSYLYSSTDLAFLTSVEPHRKKTLTMEVVRALANGEISPADIVENYEGRSVTSGIYSFYTELPDGFAFMMGFGDIEKPYYIRLINTKTNEAIDILTESIDVFIGR